MLSLCAWCCHIRAQPVCGLWRSDNSSVLLLEGTSVQPAGQGVECSSWIVSLHITASCCDWAEAAY